MLTKVEEKKVDNEQPAA
jgi:hypothetical protein